MLNKVEFKGECMGVGLRERGSSNGDNHVMIVLMTEDDENWFEKDILSSHWLDELINMLQTAKSYMQTNCDPDIYEIAPGNSRQYGFKFKEQS
jgi:hypothetical protein